MSRFDLSKADDFAAVTAGSAAAILSEFAGGASDWDIFESSYNGVLFHIFRSKSEYQGAVDEVNDQGGRRKVRYAFPYKDGQTTDDLGRKAYAFEFNILIHGQRYLVGLRDLLAELNKPQPGNLVHPIRGEIRVVPTDFNIAHRSDSRKAVLIKATFEEHNYTIGEFRQVSDTTTKGALARALDGFQQIAAAAAAVASVGNLANSLKARLTQSIDEYNNGFGQTLGRLNTSFNSGGAADFPALLPTNLGGNQNSDGTNAANTFGTVLSPQDPLAGIDTELLSAEAISALAAQQMVVEVTDRRSQLQALLDQYREFGMELDLYDSIQGLQQTALLMQDVLEKGLASSQARIVDYTVPRLMSIREIAFANGVPMSRVQDIDILNRELPSVNFIAKGTVVKVPV